MKSIIDRLSNVSSRKEKERILTEHKENELFKKVLKATYDNSIKYYITDCVFTPTNENITLDNAIDYLLNEIATRKVTGNLAQETVNKIYSSLPTDDRYVFKLVLERNLGCGISTTTINKVFSELITDPKKLYMRCSTYDKSKISKIAKPNDLFYVQEKLDGLYCNYDINNQDFITRNLKQLPLFVNQYEAFVDIVRGVNNTQLSNGDYILQGELLIKDKITNEILPREVGNGMLNSKNNLLDLTKYKVVYYVWDVISKNVWLGKQQSKPYYDRLQFLQDNVKFLNDCVVVPQTIQIYHNGSFESEVDKLLDLFLSRGSEGIVIKHSKMLWEGKTSKYQLKYKKVIEVDLLITDLLNGVTGSNKGKLSILHCESLEGELQVNVGIGLSDEVLEDIRNNMNNWLGKVVAIKAFGITTNDNGYSLFLPRFVELRLDKDEPDSIDRIKEIDS